jgi:CBS domain-containing protein
MDVKVRDVMTPGPIGVDYNSSIGEAARTMHDWGVGAVLVVHDQALYGLVTDRDLVVRAVAESKGPDEPVGPLSSADLIGVNADQDAAEAIRLMRENAVRRLPVVDGGQVAGMVSLGDLAMPATRRPRSPGSARRAPTPDRAEDRSRSTMTRKMRDIMSAAPECMAATESVSAAARAMRERGIGTVLVMEDGRLYGLLTDRDITVRVLAEDRDPLATRLADICSTDLPVLGPDDDVAQATRLVRERAVRRIPIVANGTPVGVVSIGDLALEADGSSALSGVSAAPPSI